jgi:hypothetical protein
MSSNSYEYFVDGIALTSVSLFGLIGTLLSIRVLVNSLYISSWGGLGLGLLIDVWPGSCMEQPLLHLK